MSTPLRDFLQEKGAQYAAQTEKNRVVIEEWQAAVDRLYTQLEAWLAAADPDGYIRHDRSKFEVKEPGLGRYPIERLNLRAFGEWVGLIPKARITVKRATPPQNGAPEQATGRVDITDEIRRYVLYRFSQGAEERWYVDDTALRTEMQPLTPELFEKALLGYFR